MPTAIFNKGTWPPNTSGYGPEFDLNAHDGLIRPGFAIPCLPSNYAPVAPMNPSAVLGDVGDTINHVPIALFQLELAKELRIVYSLTDGAVTNTGDTIISRERFLSAGSDFTNVTEVLHNEDSSYRGEFHLDAPFAESLSEEGAYALINFNLRIVIGAHLYDSQAKQWRGLVDITIFYLQKDDDLIDVHNGFLQRRNNFVTDAHPESETVVLTAFGQQYPMYHQVVTGSASAISGTITITAHSWLDWE
jgi:hypothetical protein